MHHLSGRIFRLHLQFLIQPNDHWWSEPTAHRFFPKNEITAVIVIRKARIAHYLNFFTYDAM